MDLGNFTPEFIHDQCRKVYYWPRHADPRRGASLDDHAMGASPCSRKMVGLGFAKQFHVQATNGLGTREANTEDEAQCDA